jgi:molybdenum cofactor biosynthesis enzyme MoaA
MMDTSSTLKHALALAKATGGVALPAPARTRQRTLTRRGVIWLGQTCNLRCKFCYFIDRIASAKHPEHPFMALEKASQICRTLKDFYGNTSVDIQGGEPTIYPEIFSLVKYCRDIGLYPTLITNGIVLDKIELCRNFQEAGLRDFLISVHGLGSVYDELVGCPGGSDRQMKALCNLQETGIPFRFNCVLAKPVLPQLAAIARLAVETGALAVNFISFNPFEDQTSRGDRSMGNVPTYSEVRPALTEALDLLAEAGVEANVRYFPFCMLEPRHYKSCYNFQQLSYDHHEWDFASWGWTGLSPQRQRDGELSPPVHLTAARWWYGIKKPIKWLSRLPVLRSLLFEGHRLLTVISGSRNGSDGLYREVAKLNAEVHCRYVYAQACQGCSLKGICDGFHGDYAQLVGTDEASPVNGMEAAADPCRFIGDQVKCIEPEDGQWALPAQSASR